MMMQYGLEAGPVQALVTESNWGPTPGLSEIAVCFVSAKARRVVLQLVRCRPL